jgi:hypothetical protein
VAPFPWIMHLLQAVVTGEEIGGDVDAWHATGLAGQDTEITVLVGLRAAISMQSRLGDVRCQPNQVLGETLQRLRSAFTMHLYLAKAIAYPACNVQLVGQAIDEWAEANALYLAGDYPLPGCRHMSLSSLAQRQADR